jgi:hypothetical protein
MNYREKQLQSELGESRKRMLELLADKIRAEIAANGVSKVYNWEFESGNEFAKFIEGLGFSFQYSMTEQAFIVKDGSHQD